MGKFTILGLPLALLFSFQTNVARAQGARVGREAAARYIAAVPVDDQDDSGAPAKRSKKKRDDDLEGNHVLMLGLGSYISSQAYQWKGSGKRDSVGRANYGLTYLIDRWKAMDVNLRADFFEYQIDDDHPTKLSVLPLITFPGADSKFPLYFGAGVGLGVFFKQVPDESNISIDYELVAGARFQDLFNNFGFFFEFAMKNHLFILSDGQLNGTTLTAGGVFTF